MMRGNSMHQAKTRRWATAAAEFALFLPVLCFMFVAIIDFGRVFYFSIAVNNCARNGALYGSQDPTSAVDTAGISTAALKDTFNMTAAQLTESSTTDSATSPT